MTGRSASSMSNCLGFWATMTAVPDTLCVNAELFCLFETPGCSRGYSLNVLGPIHWGYLRISLLPVIGPLVCAAAELFEDELLELPQPASVPSPATPTPAKAPRRSSSRRLIPVSAEARACL